MKANVYELPSDARIVDAINMAGGFMPDAACDYLNLAAGAEDGMRIYVPTYEELEKAGSDADSGDSGGGTLLTGVVQDDASSNRSSKVNINTADAVTLMTLPGVGESKANAIISFRQENGRFNSIEDLMKITGIKEGLFNKVKDSICVK